MARLPLWVVVASSLADFEGEAQERPASRGRQKCRAVGRDRP